MAGMQVSAETRHFLFSLGDAQRSHMLPTELCACPAIWGTSPDIRASICNWARTDCPCPRSCPCGQDFDQVAQTDQTWSFPQQSIQVLAGAQLLDCLFMAAI
eukprot:sb/3478362/